MLIGKGDLYIHPDSYAFAPLKLKYLTKKGKLGGGGCFTKLKIGNIGAS